MVFDMDEFVQQVIYQMPVVVVLIYILQGREKRINDLEKSVSECLESKKTDN